MTMNDFMAIVTFALMFLSTGISIGRFVERHETKQNKK